MLDMDQLVESITRIIMQRLEQQENRPKVACFGQVPKELVNDGCLVTQTENLLEAQDADYIVLTASAFRDFHGENFFAPADDSTTAAPADKPDLEVKTVSSQECRTIDFTNKKLLHEGSLNELNLKRGEKIIVSRKAIVTSLANDFIRGCGAILVRE